MNTIFTRDAVFDARGAFSMAGLADAAPEDITSDWIFKGYKAIVDCMRDAWHALDVDITCHHGHCHEIDVLSETDANGVVKTGLCDFSKSVAKPTQVI